MSSTAFAGTTTYAYRVDGLLAGETLGNSESVTLAYDAAKRPTSIAYASAGTLGQTYLRNGNVATESRTLSCSRSLRP